jgi:hypothetical protein
MVARASLPIIRKVADPTVVRGGMSDLVAITSDPRDRAELHPAGCDLTTPLEVELPPAAGDYRKAPTDAA